MTHRDPPRAFLALLHGWLAAGLLGRLLPVGAWPAHYVGPSAWWGVAAPAICLALLHRHRLAAAAALLVRRPRRRHLSRRVPPRAAASFGAMIRG